MKTLYRVSSVQTLGRPGRGEWILVDERHIQRVGSGEPPSNADRVVELPGTHALPGFIDSHVHLTGTGLHSAHPQISSAGSCREFLEALAAIVKTSAGPLLVHGFDETKWSDRRMPTIAELDDASERALIAVRVDGHLSLANTEAINGSGAIDAAGLERDAKGNLTGCAREEANDVLQRWYSDLLDDHAIERFQLQAASLAASRGVTSVHEMSLPRAHGSRDLTVLLGHRTRLPVDVTVYVATTDIPLVMDRGLSTIGGDLSLDGSIGARTARLTAPYVDHDTVGTSYLDDGELREFMRSAHLAGLQLALHAIGDAAIEQAIGCWESVYQTLDSRERRHFRARRHRIEHFEMPRTDQIERAAMLGLAVSVQPAFDAEWGHPGSLYELRLGEERAQGMNPFRALMDRGIEIGAGSDSPITPLDPMYGIWSAENHHDSNQRLARSESIGMFTSGGARLSNDDKKGRLEPGAHADFAVYERDPMIEEEVTSLRPVLTVSMGREVFAR